MSSNCHSWGNSTAGRHEPFRKSAEIGFNVRVQRLETLIGRLRQCCERFPDKRRGMNATYSIADIGMAAFSVFFMQSPSFLAHQRQLQEGHGRSNCESLFGLAKIPSDNHIRAMLDPADPALLHPVFGAVVAEIEQSGALSAFRRPGNHVLIALDGTEYFCSNDINCAQCSTRLRGRPSTTTPCSPRRWSRPGTTTSCRCSRSSSHRRTAP